MAATLSAIRSRVQEIITDTDSTFISGTELIQYVGAAFQDLQERLGGRIIKQQLATAPTDGLFPVTYGGAAGAYELYRIDRVTWGTEHTPVRRGNLQEAQDYSHNALTSEVIPDFWVQVGFDRVQMFPLMTLGVAPTAYIWGRGALVPDLDTPTNTTTPWPAYLDQALIFKTLERVYLKDGNPALSGFSSTNVDETINRALLNFGGGDSFDQVATDPWYEETM